MRYEIGLTILPEALGKRLDALISKRHPYVQQKNVLRRTIILDALGEYLDKQEGSPFVTHPIGTEIPGKVTSSASEPAEWTLAKVVMDKAGYKTAEEAIQHAK